MPYCFIIPAIFKNTFASFKNIDEFKYALINLKTIQKFEKNTIENPVFRNFYDFFKCEKISAVLGYSNAIYHILSTLSVLQNFKQCSKTFYKY